MKRSKQFFYQLYSNCGRKFAQSNRQDSKLFTAFHSFSKTIQRLFQFSENQELFKAGLEFKAGTGTLLQSNRHHQQTNTQIFYRLDVLPVTQPTTSEH